MRVLHARDSYSEPLAVYRAALARGMDYVAVTDHDSIDGALELLATPGVDARKVIVGEEVECRFPETGQWVHVNVLGLSEADHGELQRLKGDVREVCAYCIERDLLAILAHPFQSYRGQKPLEDYVGDVADLFGHVEGLNGAVPALQNRAVGALCHAAARHGRPFVQVGGSDAHTLRRVGRAYTEAKGRTASEFMAEIKAGRCRVGGESQTCLGMNRDVYAAIAAYFFRLYTGKVEAGSRPRYLLELATATGCIPAVVGLLPLAIVVGNEIRQQMVSWVVLASLSGMEWREAAPGTASSPEGEVEKRFPAI